MTSKKDLSETDIITQFILPAILRAGWDLGTQIRQNVYFTNGRILVNGSTTSRGERKFADIILYYKSNIPIAIIEAKDNNHTVGSGIQQALGYAEILDIPIAFSSNGDGFLETDLSGSSGGINRNLSLDQFPSPEEVWAKYKYYKGIQTSEEEKIASFDYFIDMNGREPRYYQSIAINRTVEKIAKGENRLLLVLATGTGKTYIAFQIIHRLWKSGTKQRVLFLADRNALIDQTTRGDFKHFKGVMTVIRKKIIDKAYEIYLALYQGLSATGNNLDAFKKFSPDFFDLIVVDECHRGSASADSSWREILEYFKSATQIGLTATPKETTKVSNIEYFGEPIYTYSLRQGIEDGFLAPYKVIRVGLNIDLEGWRPEVNKKDLDGDIVEDREYNHKDFDRNLVIDERTKAVAKRIKEFLQNKPYDKTIIFCVDIEHAERMCRAIQEEFKAEVLKNRKYVMRITGDEKEGKKELDNFINPEERYPVIACTSKLMTTGVDAQTCKLIVLDSNINSMTEFKQIIGRGTRVNEEYEKFYFTIMDFRNVTKLFSDPTFDGDPVMIKELREEDSMPDDNQTGEDLPNESDTENSSSTENNISITSGGVIEESKVKEKVYVNGVDVSILNERVQQMDENGKLVTQSLKEYTKKGILRQYKTLEDFKEEWNKVEKKEVLIHNLKTHGLDLDELKEKANKDLDIFDLLIHIAWDEPPLTRRERVERVKKRNYFAKYGDKARKILETLLDKYGRDGIENIENLEILKVEPFVHLGTPIEILKEFGGKDKYKSAIKELEKEIYTVAA